MYDPFGQIAESVSADGLRTGTVYYDNGQAAYTGTLLAAAPADWFVRQAAQANLTAAQFRQFLLGSFAQQDGRRLVTSYAYGLSDDLPPLMAAAGAESYDRVTDALGHATKTYRDQLGRTLRTELHDNSVADAFYSTGTQAASMPPTGAGMWVDLDTPFEITAGLAAGGRHEVRLEPRQPDETGFAARPPA